MACTFILFSLACCCSLSAYKYILCSNQLFAFFYFLSSSIRLIKTLAKPLTTRLKKEAKRFKSFSTFCIGAGQLTHQVSSRFTALAQGYRVKEINPLPEEDALVRGISFVSESFLFLVAGGIIVIEFNRSEEKNAIKAEAAKRKEEEFRQYLEERFAAIDRRVHEMEERLNKIEVIFALL